jgi:hypothetical protein
VLHNDTNTGNAVRFNSIHDNGKLGINLLGGTENASGVTTNDPDDFDFGDPNNLQNFPTSDYAGRFCWQPERRRVAQFKARQHVPWIEIFSNPSCDASGFGEGETFNASTNLTTDGTGNAFGTVQIPIGVFSGFVY